MILESIFSISLKTELKYEINKVVDATLLMEFN
jgi:hypothetical protein